MVVWIGETHSHGLPALVSVHHHDADQPSAAQVRSQRFCLGGSLAWVVYWVLTRRYRRRRPKTYLGEASEKIAVTRLF
jgi:drug/metabolite transporter (DMT)-like permease